MIHLERQLFVLREIAVRANAEDSHGRSEASGAASTVNAPQDGILHYGIVSPPHGVVCFCPPTYAAHSSNDLPRVVGRLGHPVPEAGPEAVLTAAMPKFLSSDRNVSSASVGVENFHRTPAERHPAVAVHPCASPRMVHTRPAVSICADVKTSSSNASLTGCVDLDARHCRDRRGHVSIPAAPACTARPRARRLSLAVGRAAACPLGRWRPGRVGSPRRCDAGSRPDLPTPAHPVESGHGAFHLASTTRAPAPRQGRQSEHPGGRPVHKSRGTPTPRRREGPYDWPG